jgi:hypothetical protein
VADSTDIEEWNNRIESSAALFESPLAAMPVEYVTPAIEDRALEVRLLLADPAPAHFSCGV